MKGALNCVNNLIIILVSILNLSTFAIIILKMEKYNKLTFIRFTEPKVRTNKELRKMALFRCDCGNESIKDYSSIKSGYNTQCKKCAIKSRSAKLIKHSLINHKLYRKWQDMLNRCRNPKVDRYKNYGGRGIKVCNEWTTSFKDYYDWCISNGWSEGLQVDRIDVNGNYEPNNCRIVKPVEQGFNKQNTVYIEHNGVKYSLAKLCYEQNLNYHVIYKGVLKRKIPFEKYIKKYNIKLNDQTQNK